MSETYQTGRQNLQAIVKRKSLSNNRQYQGKNQKVGNNHNGPDILLEWVGLIMYSSQFSMYVQPA